MASEGKAEVSGGQPAEPIAVVGMACRFPSATGLPAFWRQLEAGESAVIEGVPGSGVGRVGYLFPDPAVQAEACRFGAYIDNIDQFDAGFFRISPVEAQLLDPQQRLDAGDELAGSRRRRDRSGHAQGQPYRGLRGHQQQRIPGADPGCQRYCRPRHQPLYGHWNVIQHRHRSCCVRARAAGTGDSGGHGLLLVARGGAPGGDRATARRGGPGARGRRARHSLGAPAGAEGECWDAGA